MTTPPRIAAYLCLAFLAACLLQACAKSDELRKAELAVTAFREAVQRGAFKEIYAAGSPELRNAMGEDSFVGLMQAVSGKLGAPVSSELKEYRIDHEPSMALVTMGYVTRFQQGVAFEKFVFKLDESGAALGSYGIHSPAF